MAQQEIPPELQQDIQQLQALSGQAQAVAQQRRQFELMHAEAKRALEALAEMAEDATVYRTVGSLMVQEEKVKAEARLKDDLETMELRVKRAKEQEKAMEENLQKLQAKLQKALAGAQ